MVKKEMENFFNIRWLDEYMMGHKGFIAGGCFKNIFNKENVNDLDIFFNNENDFNEAVNYFDAACNDDDTYRFYYENKKVKAYKNNKSGIVIELIRYIYGTPEDILNNFDFTITKFAYYKEEVEDDEITEDSQFSEDVKATTHIEYKVLCHDLFFEHLLQKRLVIDDKILFPSSSFERTYKYAKYGYFPCKETKLKLIKALRDMPNEIIELSNSLYDGID